MFLVHVLEGLLLPVILVFLLAGRQRLLGRPAGGRVLLGRGWLVTVASCVMPVVLVVPRVVGQDGVSLGRGMSCAGEQG